MVYASEAVEVECVEPADVSLDDLDFMGNLHNGRYPMLVERALVRIWARAGYSFVDGVPTHPDVVHVVIEQTVRYRSPVRTVGRVNVAFRMERLGKSSMVYAFRVVSDDGGTVHAEGTRTEVNVDMSSLGSAPWAGETRETALRLFGPPAADTSRTAPASRPA
ncbi:acyl-CoA thioesterase [Streptomyces sp. NBC_01092]|uniref:acyl-CoA thioesterase n=1 Tax=Streptomyces sp. NBC_01092 TaxID=2903748 RepID=UPI00386E531B|nr:acyl-CoA thioesterase [Streptomyces sp. NBC_01092]